MSTMYRRLLGDTGDDAWAAVEAKAQQRNYGTSKADIDAYAGAAGGVAATAGCAYVGAAAASPLCAAVGSALASGIADAIQTIGAGLFSGGSPQEQPNDTWNPVADKAIAGVVKALRASRGLDTAHPPGGSARGWPEWRDVAVVWARHVNALVAAQGGPQWFYDSPADKDPGRIRQAAIDQWATTCDQPWKAAWSKYTAFGGKIKKPTLDDFPACKALIAPVPEAMVRATQATARDVLGSGAATKPTSTATKVVVGATVLGVIALLLRLAKVF